MSKVSQSVLHGCPTDPQWRLVGVQERPGSARTELADQLPGGG
jgi:hypothetical protein